MILNKLVAQNNTTNQSNRALSLLMEVMAVWYPAPCYDIEAIVFEETRGLKSNRRAKVRSSVLPATRSKNKKPLGVSHSASVYA